MDVCGIVCALGTVADQYATCGDDFTKLVKKTFILSLKYVNQKDLWNGVFGESEYVDWSLVERCSTNVFGNITHWMALVPFCSFESLHRCEAEIANEYLCLSNMRRNLRSTGLDPGAERGWTIAGMALLFTLLRGVPTMHALEMLTCAEFR